MPLINTISLLNEAKNNNYCIGAFNIENFDMAKAIIEAAEKMKMPAIIQTTYTTINYAGAKLLKSMVHALAENSKAELSLHLDHGNSFDICSECIKTGYNSVMFDGSHYSLEENIRRTNQVVQLSKKYNVSVEGEIGTIGGVEDEVVGSISYTDTNECAKFISESGIDFVAIGVGTSHGIYKGQPQINFQRIYQIKQQVNTPLVLHGASGLSENIIKKCIQKGINKINFATELRQAYTQAIRETLKDQNTYDPKLYQLAAREKVKEAVMEKMRILTI